MNAKHLIKKSIIVGIIFLTTIGLMFPSTLASVEKDSADGVWTDNFEPNKDGTHNVTLIDCTFENNNTIVLNTSTNEIKYNFTDDRSHEAYSYVTPFFLQLFPPDSHIKREYKLREYTGEIYKIEEPDDKKYYSRSSTGLKRYVVHHFRFKLEAEAEDIGNLSVYWFGKATKDRQIELYFWKYFSKNTIFGFWSRLDYDQSNETDISLSHNITHDNIKLSLNEDNYLDICVVAIPKSTTCTLYTDYVEIISETEEGYMIGYGTATTKDYIEPRNISKNITDFYWDILTWDDYTRGGATVKYHVLYEVNVTNKTYEKINDSDLEGNENGFTEPPIYLNSLNTTKYDKLKIMANLSTDTHLVSPKIFSWAVTWQTNTHRWRDLFNYDFRLEKNKVNVSGGNVSIDPITGDWPMFGQNPQNTRSTEGKGPDSDDFNWFSVIGDEDEEILSPVIRDGVLYTSYLTSTKLYYIPDIRVIRDEEWKTPKYEKDFDNDKWLVSSPAITEDSIIISTGKTDNEGTSNYVIALDKTDFSEKWPKKFVYPEDICYSSSPVVYEDKVFVTSWSGDPDLLQSNTNNKVIALDLSHGTQLWEYDLPAGSYSTPAVYKNMVFVGCNEGNGNSLFAIDADSGDSLWNKSVGAIGRSSPVVHDDTVFVVSEDKNLGVTERAKVTALIAENGSILWERTIGRKMLSIAKGLLDPTRTLADSTPAAFADDLFVASPDGWLFALDVNNGSEKWSHEVYKKNLFDDILLDCSPAYADGVVYIGTPSGTFYALDASDGEKKWDFKTFDLEKPFNTPPIVTSPVVSSGLIFFGDNNGKLYSMGKFIEPDQEIDGSVTSIPIKLPQGYWWDSFKYTRDNISTDNSITFSILDEDKNFIKEIKNDDTIGDITIDRTLRLRADLYAKNLSVNPQLRDWRVTFVVDSVPPLLDKSTFTPNPEGWFNEIPSVFSVEVKDDESGLLISSAEYVLGYSIENESHSGTFNANCTGEDGTTNVETITANISKLAFYQNITGLTSIDISIYDLAGNGASLIMPLTLDTDKPWSNIINGSIKERYNSEYKRVVVNATAKDNTSGILKVGLWYRYSQTPDFSGDWIKFGYISNDTTPTWNFTADKGGGYYELSTIAEDKAHNVEDEKEKGDASFIFDPNPPTMPKFTDPFWFNTTPIISIEFTDDFLLDTIEYCPNFETDWTTIDSDINETIYDSPWTLLPKYWDQMVEGEEYYLYFRLTDSLGNINIIEDQNEAITIRKDISVPNVDLEIPDLEAEWSWDDTFNISVYAYDRNGSIQTVELWYRYSEDNITWSNWTKYKDELTTAPYVDTVDTEWEFHAEEGNGYYEFYVRAEDAAGNIAESGVFSTGVNMFPLIFVVTMVILVVALLLFTIILFVLWRKKKE